jgi:hypothetical protein
MPEPIHQRTDEDDEGDPLEEDDPLSVLIERIAAVKSSFEDFHSRLDCICKWNLLIRVSIGVEFRIHRKILI